MACRASDAQAWTVLAAISRSSRSDTEVYYPAGADQLNVIEQLADQLMDGIPLSVEEERSLITQNWSQGSP